jgi:hypothetical protein
MQNHDLYQISSVHQGGHPGTNQIPLRQKSSEQSKNWACQRILSTSQIDSVHSSSIIVNDLCLHRQVMEQTHGVKVTQPTGDSYLTGDNLT